MRRYYSALKYAGQSIVRKFGENDFMSKKKAAALFAVGIIGIALGGGIARHKTDALSDKNIGVQVWFEDTHVYRVIYDSVYNVNVIDGNSSELPEEFIIAPSVYSVEGKSYDMYENGVYRFITPSNEQIQRIVWNGEDIDDLLSSLAWCQIHTNGVEGATPEEYDEQVKRDMIYCTCGYCSLWVRYECESVGVECRLVSSITLEERNYYNDGHSLVEIKWDYDGDGEKEWACYDVDNNCRFELNGQRLNLNELVDCIKNKNDYSIIELAQDPRGIAMPSAAIFSFSFICEEVSGISNLRKWYGRVMQVCLILDEDGYYYFADEEGRNRVESYYSQYRYMEKENFVDKYY